MKKLMPLLAALVGIAGIQSALAQMPMMTQVNLPMKHNATCAQLQQVSQETYRMIERPARLSMNADDMYIEQVYNNAYTSTVGGQPDFDNYLAWKYLTNYPDSRISQGTAAIREMPASGSDSLTTRCVVR